MAKLVINSYEDFASHLGEKLGESDWLQIDQDRINKFADALTTAPSITATSPSLYCHISGSRSSR